MSLRITCSESDAFAETLSEDRIEVNKIGCQFLSLNHRFLIDWHALQGHVELSTMPLFVQTVLSRLHVNASQFPTVPISVSQSTLSEALKQYRQHVPRGTRAIPNQCQVLEVRPCGSVTRGKLQWPAPVPEMRHHPQLCSIIRAYKHNLAKPRS